MKTKIITSKNKPEMTAPDYSQRTNFLENILSFPPTEIPRQNSNIHD